ncbi:hypothetical protein P4O66_019562 [Electrophorus voltai]|uniref:Uncharacterized protein n=1 Tax=Electrophorus voltai TaxID=2609070 RepID=A0AAD8ZUR6_9TELE|nr:hypothetical protein P4O66_019562 [Electrophorus voltai]
MKARGVDVGGRNGINHAENGMAVRTLGLSECSNPPSSSLMRMPSISKDGGRGAQTGASYWTELNGNVESCPARCFYRLDPLHPPAAIPRFHPPAEA